MSLFSWGRNTSGELGLNEAEELQAGSLGKKLLAVATPQSVGHINHGKSIAHVSAGEKHSLVITSGGDVYTWGRNKEGQLGRSGVAGECQQVTALASQRGMFAGCGSMHTILVTTNRRVFHWGLVHDWTGTTPPEASPDDRASNPEIRLLSEDMDVPAPPNMGEAQEESFRRRRDMVHRSNMQYYGASTMANFKRRIEPVPCEVVLAQRLGICKVYAGYCFSLMIAADGAAYAMGLNDKGQLGIGNRVNTLKPSRVGGENVEFCREKKIVGAGCGNQHSAFLTSDGEVYTCGLGVFGALGYGEIVDSQTSPRRVESLVGNPVAQIDCGTWHTVAVTCAGRLYSWGSGSYMQLGNSGEGHHMVEKPTPVTVGENIPSDTHFVRVSCGDLHNAVLDENGYVYTFGWSSCGQIGAEGVVYAVEPMRVSRVQNANVIDVSCGGGHTLLVQEGTSGQQQYEFNRAVHVPAKASQLGLYGCDVYYMARKPIQAHRAIIAMRCPKLRRQLLMAERFCQGDPMHGMRDIFGPGSAIRPYAFMSILQYLYTDDISDVSSLGMLTEVSKLALHLDLPRLAALCEGYKSAIGGGEGSERRCIPPSRFRHDVEEMLDQPEPLPWADVLIEVVPSSQPPECKPCLFTAHSFVLTYRSSYFKKLLESSENFSEGAMKTGTYKYGLRIKMDDPQDFLKVRLGLYGGIDEGFLKTCCPDELISILAWSDRFMLDEVKDNCELLLERALMDDYFTSTSSASLSDDEAHTILLMLQVSSLYNCIRLFNSTVACCAAHLGSIGPKSPNSTMWESLESQLPDIAAEILRRADILRAEEEVAGI